MGAPTTENQVVLSPPIEAQKRHASGDPRRGIFLLENLDLEAMSRDKVYEFALIVQPLKLKGGTGSTVAPTAVR